MECCIGSHELKIFARAVHCLSKIGEDVNFEVKSDTLELRAVNQSRSAFAFFSFAHSFFEFYHLTSKSPQPDGTGCRLGCKALLASFKSLKAINQSVERCFITLSEDEARLIIKLQCRHGIVKTHQLFFEDCETLCAMYDKASCRSVVSGSPQTIIEGVANFQAGLEEMTIRATRDKLELSNYVEIGPDSESSECLSTHLSLDPSEFSQYEVRKEVSLVFCLKELKALLVFVDYVSEPLSMHFGRGGQPIIFSQEARSHRVEFVFATLDNGGDEDDDDDDMADSQTHQTPGATLSYRTPHPPEPMQMTADSARNDDGVTPSLLDPATPQGMLTGQQQTPFMTSSINNIAPSYTKQTPQDDASPDLAMPTVGSATQSQHTRVPDTDDDDEELVSTPPKRHAGLRKAVSDTVMELSAELDGKLCADTDEED
eukprot:m.41492 g.41492  ORF g.41492 m.41492 type:complete len:429 (+) comp12837_c0_seq2:66-1352(+)